MEMQEKLSNSQDEIGIGKVIEGGKARALMAKATLKSCNEMWQQQQENLGEKWQYTEKIDEHVNEGINLESAISSQTMLIQWLKLETDDLQALIQILLKWRS
ncbi:hypothetical protein Nepgr_027134 [Nepenthes gracilis]|uniref:NET2A-D/KIP1-like alpha-helical domain-containing protein n=1 Tax=Nepenthes gracilis TaxID=150966 RepID=A0AAD3Y389_NEPGR|nr:hypothetical protein Nepgr_027134 [Nepenthes gracilis]